MVRRDKPEKHKGKVVRLRQTANSDDGRPGNQASNSDGAGGDKKPTARLSKHLNMAHRFVAEHGQEFRYVKQLGWLAWDGCRWSPDVDNAPLRAVIETIKRAGADALALPMGSPEQKALLGDFNASQTSAAVNGIAALASGLRPVATSVDQLDADPYLFNIAGGQTIELRTGKVRPARREDLITKVAGCGLPLGDGDEKAPVFDAFFERIMPDEEVRAFLMRLFGYSMLGVMTEHIFPLFYGIGQNGKTTLCELMKSVFGDYARTVESEVLMASKGSKHPTEIADLRGVRLAITAESDEGRKFNAARLKHLTGGETITARKMHKDSFEFAPSHTIIMHTNHRPEISADDYAMWRRVREIDFTVKIPDAERDSTLPERLELERSAVLARILAGYEDYARIGLAAPSAVESATASYRESGDSLAEFWNETYRRVENGKSRVKFREVYEDYCEWCKLSGSQPLPKNSFSARIQLRPDLAEYRKPKNVPTLYGIERLVE